MASVSSRRACRAAVALATLLVAPLGGVFAQLPAGTQVKGFQFPIHDSENRLNCLISGATATPHANGRIQIEQLRLETYKPDGKPDFLVEAPHCTFDPKQRTASSPGKLDARTADGRLAISGEGFSWDQTTGRLVISNRVHTVIRNPASTNEVSKP